MTEPSTPLADLRVIDVSTVLAGPSCARYLADFGADVIKVERPDGGDSWRRMGWLDHDGTSLWWKLTNRGKRCIALDLKDSEDRMEKALDVFRNELKGLRTGRASPQMLDSIRADNYGSMSPLREMASITCPDAASIVIKPYSADTLKEIEKAIRAIISSGSLKQKTDVVTAMTGIGQTTAAALLAAMPELGTMDRKLQMSDMQGGTFTITNLGGIGGTSFTPIVNYPEVAILGMSRSQSQLKLEGGQVVERLMLPLSLSYDHRVINGADAARFIGSLSGSLSDFMRLLVSA